MSTEERLALAREYFLEGYNCSQSVVLSFLDEIGVDKDSLERLSIGLGGGVGRMREVCGAVSGMAVVAGFVAGITEGDANKDRKVQKTEVYTLVQKLAGDFRNLNGSIICRELLQLRQEEKCNPVPQDRTSEYYHTRPCLAMVESAVRILSEYIENRRESRVDMFANI